VPRWHEEQGDKRVRDHAPLKFARPIRVSLPPGNAIVVRTFQVITHRKIRLDPDTHQEQAIPDNSPM
jgi:hypothetical protein